MRLNNKVAIILGGIKGIGKALALDLLKAGTKVAITWFDWEDSFKKLKSDIANIEKNKQNYMIEKINLLETDKIKKFIEKVIKIFGRLDILVNNIERGGWPIVHGKYTQKQWDLEMETTLRAKQWIFENSIPYLKASGNGSIINFSSIAGIVGRSGPTSLIFNDGYSVANRGISLLTETWARIGAPEVRVNEIMLGIFETRHGPDTRGWNLLNNNQKEEIVNHTLIGRIGDIDDILKTVHFLLCNAPFITGITIRLDGGYVLGGEKIMPMPRGII